ncbi:MAG: hypothetical protein GQ577_03875 [Woeseiaceae bacterium]|nr:hypothetical protein [Woeseiaceae bacterium]
MADNFRVSGFVLGLAIKAPCHTHAEVNITPLSGTGQTIGGYVVSEFDRVLLTAQTDPIDNGIYSVRGSGWVRDGDADGNRDFVGGTLVPVWTIAQTDIVLWRLGGDPDAKTVGTDALTFTPYYDPLGGAGGFGTLQQVTDAGSTTTNNIIMDGARLDVQDGGDIRMFNVGDTRSVIISVGAALGTDAVRLVASAGVDVFSFDEALDIDNNAIHIGATQRLAFYQFDEPVASYIRGASGSSDIEYVTAGASHVFNSELEIPSYRVPTVEFILAANAVTIDVNQTSACFVDVDPATADFNVTLTTPAKGTGFYYEIVIDFIQGTPDFSPIWPASVKWPIGVAPTLSPQVGDLDTVHLYTRDGGVTWKGSFLLDYS